MFISLLFANPRLFFAEALLVVFSICCHEFMHAWTALKFGDPTAADAGHLTLNPLKQMGLESLALLCFLGIAWGQVPVNPSRMRGRYAPVAVAMAGPLTNLVLSFLFVILFVFCLGRNIGHEFAWSMLSYAATLNLVLAVLNALPVPGLDGWNIVRLYRPQLLTNSSEFVRGSFFVIVMLLFVFFRHFWRIANFLILAEAQLLWKLIGRTLQ